MRKLAGLLLCAACIAAASCSTTRVLKEGEYRLASNKVVVEGGGRALGQAELSPYIRQQANSYFIFGWSPSLNIYNWSNPERNDWINNALRKVGVAPVVFNGAQVANSRENIANHLDYLGYYNSDVTSRVDTTGRLVKVTYLVKPGSRCRIDSLRFDIPEGEFRDEFYADTSNLLIHKGDYLSEKILEEESVRSSSYFRDKGYYSLGKFNYFFTADTLGAANVLTYSVRGYTRNETDAADRPLLKYRIGNVSISHSDDIRFNDDILRKLNIIHPGDLYSEKMVNVNYNRLTSLRLFNNVSVVMQPVDSTTVDCRIKMGESNQQGVKFNLEASTNSSGLLGISPALSFYHKNIFRGGEWLSLGFNGNFQWKPGTSTRANEFGVSAGLSFPRFLGLPYRFFKGQIIPRTDIQLSLNYQDRPEFERWISSGSFGYTRNSGHFLYQIYPLRATVVRVSRMSEEFLEVLLKNRYLWDSFYDHIDAGVGATFYWTTDASLLPRDSFHYTRVQTDFSGNLISLFNPLLPKDLVGDPLLFGLPYSRYVRVAVDRGRTIRFRDESSLALRLSAGAGYALGSQLSMPFEKQFFVGGASSMRGWQSRALGPGDSQIVDYFTIPSQTGDYKLEVGAEYRRKFFWKFEAAVFAEAGNVWSYEKYSNWLSTIAADWGVGLRLNLDFILLRLDWGIKLYEPSRDEGSRWLTPAQWVQSGGSALHFGIGYPF